MHMSQNGINALIKKFEGCKLKAYKCPAGILTIGYGHTSAAGDPAVTEGMVITQQQAESMLSQDLVKYEVSVTKLVHQPLSQHEFDTLVDFCYNAGAKALADSTLLKKINAGEFDAVPAELMKWTKGDGKVLPGLVHRRQDEGTWWTTGAAADAPAIHGEEHRSTPDPVPVPSMATSSQGNAALMTAGLGGLGAAKEIAAQAQDASDTANTLVGLFSNPNFLIMAAIIGLGAAIWYFRKQHMETHGV